MKPELNSHKIVDQLATIYDQSVANLRQALAHYVEDGTPQTAQARKKGAFAYPELRIEYSRQAAAPALPRAFARLNQPGVYATSIARPELFRDYLVDQLEHLIARLWGRGLGRPVGERNPLPLRDRRTAGSRSATSAPPSCRAGSRRTSWSTSATRSPTASGISAADEPRPLALFDGPRTDFSLARLQHYTGTPAEHFQHFVLFTNYVRYVDEFVGCRDRRAAPQGQRFTGAVGARRGLRAGRADQCRGGDRRGPAGAGTRCRPTI